VRPRAKVTIESLWEVVYKESIGTKMNDLDLCLEVVSRSCQPLRDIRRWISRKPSEIEAWFQRTTNRKWHMGYQIVTDRWRHVTPKARRCCEAVWSAVLATAWLIVFIFFILFSARKHYSALYAIARPSAHPSVTWVDHSKTAEIRIVKFSPYGSPIYLYFYRVSFVHFLDLHDSISKTVRDTSKVTVND